MKPQAKEQDPRHAAIDLIEMTIRDHMPLESDAPRLKSLPPAARARAYRLATETLRNLTYVDEAIKRYTTAKPKGRGLQVLRLGAYEILKAKEEAYGVVSAMVDIAKSSPKTKSQSGLINAVLRKCADTDPKSIHPRLESFDVVTWHAVEGQYGRKTGNIIARQQLDIPPVDLTIHPDEDKAAWAEKFKSRLLPTGSVRLWNPSQISKLEGFEEGKWWVQDTAATIPARALGDIAGKDVLDLCAAPGGKSLQLGTMGAKLTALDISQQRLKPLKANLERIGVDAEVICHDALTWKPNKKFDAILLDAPCSATGTFRRHPDLRFTAPMSRLPSLLPLQADLLRKAFSWLKPGGALVYCTCSLIDAEGEAQIDAFLAKEKRAKLLPLSIEDYGIPADDNFSPYQGVIRTTPATLHSYGGTDGFFIAKITKTA